jgi:hypothetical protein
MAIGNKLLKKIPLGLRKQMVTWTVKGRKS